MVCVCLEEKKGWGVLLDVAGKVKTISFSPGNSELHGLVN